MDGTDDHDWEPIGRSLFDGPEARALCRVDIRAMLAATLALGRATGSGAARLTDVMAPIK